MRLKQAFKIVGKTTEGKDVISGICYFFNTCGVPIDTIFSFCDANNLVPCWISFYLEGLQYNWTHEGIMSRLEAAIIDVYGKSYWLEVEAKLNAFVDYCDKRAKEKEES